MLRPNLKILWITPKWPFPTTDGARVATTQLLKNLTRKGLSVHLVSLVPENEEVQLSQAEHTLGLEGVSVIRREKPSRLQQALHFLKHPQVPITLAPFAEKRIAEEILEILKEEIYDLVVYDGLHAAGFKLTTHRKLGKTLEVYRAHNVESDLWFRAANQTLNPFKKVILWLQGFLVKQFETRLTRESAFVFPVSSCDTSIFQTYVPRGKLQTLPIGIEVKTVAKFPPYSHRTRNILFIGKLDWAPNRDGLKWLLEKVWPEVLKRVDDVKLTIVGSGDGSWLKGYAHLDGITLAGAVENLAPYYEQCIATVVPVFYGSGTRVKAIESSLYGKTCISTQLGVEGLDLVDGKHYYRAEREEEWIHTIAFLDPALARQMGKLASEYANHAFNPKTIADRFIESVSPGGAMRS